MKLPTTGFNLAQLTEGVKAVSGGMDAKVYAMLVSVACSPALAESARRAALAAWKREFA